ncbi:MAG: rhodanese-like domain-containing protein [Bacteroidales bacterium]
MKTVTVQELKQMMDSGSDITLIDVREASERRVCSIEPSKFIPMHDIPENIGQIPSDRPCVVYCHHGIRSYVTIRHLENNYQFENLYNLNGGIDAWAREIDPEMARY